MNSCWPFFKSAAVANGFFLGTTYSGSTCAIAAIATNNVKPISRMLGLLFESRVYHSVQIFHSARTWLSRQSEKFLIGQSRKFLLTALRLKDGTNRDEPRGTGQAGVVEAGKGQGNQPTRGGGEDGSERPLGA